MNIDRILDFFYKRASERVKHRIEERGLSQAEIYERDPKQISWIINNKRTNNNRFLICDAVLDSYFDKHCGLVPMLGFKNAQEVLWGTESEIFEYSQELFFLLWDEVTAPNSEYGIDKEQYLCDYVPYAKYSTYYNLLFSKDNRYRAVYYGVLEDDVISSKAESEDRAAFFLFQKCALKFIEQFNIFASLTASFHKINKVFKKKFMDSQFVPMLRNFSPNEFSFGFRVKTLITDDLSKVANLITKPKTDNEQDNLNRQLIRASSNYILELEQIQKKEYEIK